jgi:hypothetical protein
MNDRCLYIVEYFVHHKLFVIFTDKFVLVFFNSLQEKILGRKEINVGGGGVESKSELFSHFSSCFVWVCLYKWNIGGGGGAQDPAGPASNSLDI